MANFWRMIGIGLCGLMLALAKHVPDSSSNEIDMKAIATGKASNCKFLQ